MVAKFNYKIYVYEKGCFLAFPCADACEVQKRAKDGQNYSFFIIKREGKTKNLILI
jgi:hypothetical protein